MSEEFSGEEPEPSGLFQDRFPPPKGSLWPKRLLIVAALALFVGSIGMARSLPELEDVLRPDQHNILIVGASDTEVLNVTGLNKYVFYQNTTESEAEMDILTIHDEQGEEIEVREPSLTAAVATLSFDDGTVYEPLGWIRPAQNGPITLSSTSNHSVYVVDQNQIDQMTWEQTDLLLSCGALLLGGCLLPVAGLLHFLRPKTADGASSVTMHTADGREVELSIDIPHGGGPVLTTDQVYALAQLSKGVGADAEMKIELSVREEVPSVPAPFADRPNQVIPEQHVPSDTKTQPKKDEKTGSGGWKDWDEG